jgi:F-type H+-transporting ATPase subunit delta
MSATRVAYRYAKALLDLSTEKNVVDKVKADMVQLNTICKESKEFRNLLSSPIIDAQKKQDIFNVLFESKMEKMSFDFMHLIIKNSREDLVHPIAEAFIKLYKKDQNILDVTVISATKLDDAAKAKILTKINAGFNGTIELTEKIDPSLIGGFIIRIDDKQIDASIASELTNLKNILLN